MEWNIDITPIKGMGMGGCDSKGIALPIITPTEIIQVSIDATDSARKAMITAMGKDHDSKVIVISVDSGGCSGYMYDMKIIDDPKDDSYQAINFDGIKVLIHNEHSIMLDGLVLDYNDSLMGGGFAMQNPNANRTCGCGLSFR
ncbi:MAG: hypothetical protein CMB64_05590 [Euryarchaeota archaeon]|nr:hypothetical protein [Euryarchaeota archaeon]|tara:strand:- start:599 stop:1027 length:429 start_codon:yes stop_codon:yes gene_type:complete